MTTTTSEAAPSTQINPAEWGALASYTLHGETHGVGEPVPPMTIEEALVLERRRAIGRRLPDGSLHMLPHDGPRDAEGYLRGPDFAVVRLLREFPAPLEQIKEIADLARKQGRSFFLQEALALVIDLKTETHALIASVIP